MTEESFFVKSVMIVQAFVSIFRKKKNLTLKAISLLKTQPDPLFGLSVCLPVCELV